MLPYLSRIFRESEDYSHRSMQILSACFVITHLFCTKFFRNAPYIRLIEIKYKTLNLGAECKSSFIVDSMLVLVFFYTLATWPSHATSVELFLRVKIILTDQPESCFILTHGFPKQKSPIIRLFQVKYV